MKIKELRKTSEANPRQKKGWCGKINIKQE